jgi:hypothetical protein
MPGTGLYTLSLILTKTLEGMEYEPQFYSEKN